MRPPNDKAYPPGDPALADRAAREVEDFQIEEMEKFEGWERIVISALTVSARLAGRLPSEC